MRRLVIGCAATALLLTGGALAGSTAVQATIPPTEAPPIVGAWILTFDDFPDEPPDLVAFHSDGTFQQASADGTSGIGVMGGNRTDFDQPDVRRGRRRGIRHGPRCR